MRQELPVHVLVDRFREFRPGLIERHRLAPAQFFGPLLPFDEMETILERAEQRVIVEPFAVTLREVPYSRALVAVDSEVAERLVEQLEAGGANRPPIAQRHLRERVAHALHLLRVHTRESVEPDIDRIDRKYAERAVGTGEARRDLVQRQQQDCAMTHRRRQLSHRTERRDVADTRVRARAQRKQRNHHAGDALNGGLRIQ